MPLDILVVIAWVMYGANIFGTIATRKYQQMYVSLWYTMGTILWTAFVYLTGNFATLFTTGVNQANLNWMYVHNAVGLIFTPVGLALAYYFIPKAGNIPLYSYPFQTLQIGEIALDRPRIAIAGDADASRKLLARGAKAQRPGWSPIHYAASGPGTDVAKLLLDSGASVDAESPNGTTPLMLAARHAPEGTVELLLQRGADPRRRNQRGLQAIDFAEAGGREYLVGRFQKLPR